MIDSLIEKYEEKIEINEEYKKSDRSYSVFYEEDIEKYAEFIKDLEELKPIIERLERDKKSILAYLDYGCGSYFELGSQHEEFLENIKEYLGVDIDE